MAGLILMVVTEMPLRPATAGVSASSYTRTRGSWRGADRFS